MSEPLTDAVRSTSLIGFGFRAGRAFEQETQAVAGLTETLSRLSDAPAPCPNCVTLTYANEVLALAGQRAKRELVAAEAELARALERLAEAGP